MAQFLAHKSRRWSHDGWALKVREARSVLDWTVCTTRAECRDLRRKMTQSGLFRDIRVDVVKVRVTVEPV